MFVSFLFFSMSLLTFIYTGSLRHLIDVSLCLFCTWYFLWVSQNLFFLIMCPHPQILTVSFWFSIQMSFSFPVSLKHPSRSQVPSVLFSAHLLKQQRCCQTTPLLIICGNCPEFIFVWKDWYVDFVKAYFAILSRCRTSASHFP